MNLDQAYKSLLRSAATGNSKLLVSGSGSGKSSIMWQAGRKLAEEGLARGEKWGIGQVFAATQTPCDLIGYQFKGEKQFTLEDGSVKTVTVSEASCPLWMISMEGKPAFMYDKFFLMIDEYGQGEADVKRGLAEIFLNGGTSPWYLPNGSIVVAASNEGSRYGVTKDFDFCIARRQKITVDPNLTVTLNHWDKPYIHRGKVWNVMPTTKAWAKLHSEFVFESEPKEQGPWGNPRAICAMDREVQAIMSETGGKLDLNDPCLVEEISGHVGTGAAVSFIAQMQFLIELPKYEEVVADPDGTPVPAKADLMLLMAYQLASLCNAEPKELSPVLKYISRMPKDMAVTFVQAALRRDYKGIMQSPPMQAWISKNASLLNLVASLSQ